MFDQAVEVVDGMRTLIRDLEPHCVRGEEAARLLSLFAEAERLAGVGPGDWRWCGPAAPEDILDTG